MKHGKNWRSAREKLDRNRDYPLDEAVGFLKASSGVKFDETVEVAINLGVDPRKSDQAVRGAVVVPHGLGKKVTVLAFAQGDKENEAREAGADFVGGEDMAEKIRGGWLEFDAVVATPDMMKVVGKLGKILGTRGLMPNPKVGTVTMEIGAAIKDLKRGKVEFRVDKNAILHVPVGKLSFEVSQLTDNIRALMDAIGKAKPAGAKGQYVKKLTVTSTMGQGIKINLNDIKN
jgi:large subunit ribosomal protein L1